MDSAEPSEDDKSRLFDAGEMIGYLEELDDLLGCQGATEMVHLQIAGGAVMLTKSSERRTQDIDVVSEGMTATALGELQSGLPRLRGEHSPRTCLAALEALGEQAAPRRANRQCTQLSHSLPPTV